MNFWIISGVLSFILIFSEHIISKRPDKLTFGLIDILGIIVCLIGGPILLFIIIYFKLK